MAYVKIVNFGAKDALTTGNPAKIIKGVEIGAEFDAVATASVASDDAIALKSALASPTFTGTVTTPAIILSSETASTIASFDASKNVKSLAVATYPSLAELAYVKGVTSAVQTQITAKADKGANSDITSLAGLTTALSIAQGGTAGTTAAAARTELGTAAIAVAQTFTAAQRGAVTSLTDAATIGLNLALNNNFSVTLAGNRTLGQPTNVVAGQSGLIVVTQDGTGSRTLAYHADYKFAGGTAPVLTTGAGLIDYLAYYVETSTRIFISISRDVK